MVTAATASAGAAGMAASERTKTIVTRDHQRDLVEGAVAILKRSDHAYVEAPPAAGKTLVLALIANELDYGRAYYLAHTVELVNQARREISLYRRQGLIRDDIVWRFMTRAAYNNLVKRASPELEGASHAAFVDECHIGGVARRGAAKKQFPAVIATSAKVVWISATPWALDEAMMGAREDNTSALSYEEAFDRDLLNDTDLVRVDCSLDIRGRLDPSVTSARHLHRSEGAEYVVAADTAEDQHRALDDIVREALGRGLRTSDVPALVRYRWELMTKLYRRRHDGEKAIFWLPSKQHARDCAAHMNALHRRDDFAEAVLGEHAGTAEAEADDKAVADWMDPQGRTKVVCVVYRLREGFDHPELAHGFDCSWNPYNYRNSVQKIGRLTRKAPDKPRGRYYYAVDAVTIAGARSRNFSRRFLESLGRAHNDADLLMTADAFDDARSMIAAMGMDFARHEAIPRIDDVDVGGRHVRMAITPVFGVLSANRVKVARPLSFEELLTESSMSAVEKLVRDVERGRKAMPSISQRGEGNMLRRAITPSNSGYRADLRQRLIDCGAFTPKEARWTDVRKRVDDTTAAIEAGTLPLVAGSETYRFMFKYFNPTNGTYRPDVRARLLACGAIVGRGNGPLGNVDRPDLYNEARRLEDLHPEERPATVAGLISTGGDLHRSTLRGYVERARDERLAAHAVVDGPRTTQLRIVMVVKGDHGLSRFEETVRAIDVVLDMSDVLNIEAMQRCLRKHLNEAGVEQAVDRVVGTVTAAAIALTIDGSRGYQINTFDVAGVRVTVACDPQEDPKQG